LWRRYAQGNEADVDKFTYGYDKNSNRLWKENVVPGELETPKHLDELYAYDELNRLTAADRGNLNANKDAVTSASFRQAWTLDDVGNWTTFKEDSDGSDPWGVLDHDRDHNKANEIEDDADEGTDAIETTTGTDWDDPAHDAQGNMTQVPVPGDETHHHVCTYDAWNRLVKVQTDAEPPVTVAEYRYDGLHRRIAKLVPNAGTPANWDRTDYYYTASWQVVEERLATNVATAHKDDVATEPTYQYIWSLRYIDACILRDENTDPESDDDCTDDGGSERIYYASGANMEVTALLEADGDVTERYIYDPYGKVTVLHGASDKDGAVTEWEVDAPGSDYANEILYSGYRYDAETGLYHARHRVYHPTLGRWLQRDPTDYIDSMSLSEYARSNPWNLVDPLGLKNAKTGPTVTGHVLLTDLLRRVAAGEKVQLGKAETKGVYEQKTIYEGRLVIPGACSGKPLYVVTVIKHWEPYFWVNIKVTQVVAEPKLLKQFPGVEKLVGNLNHRVEQHELEHWRIINSVYSPFRSMGVGVACDPGDATAQAESIAYRSGLVIFELKKAWLKFITLGFEEPEYDRLLAQLMTDLRQAGLLKGN
jgi:RHS repeat-associated protein